MIYLVFSDTTFVGYSADKKIIKRLKKERPVEYIINKVPELLLGDTMTGSPDFTERELVVNDVYHVVLSEYEVVAMYKVARDRLEKLALTATAIDRDLKFVKLPDAERVTVRGYLEFLQMIQEDLIGDESAVLLDDYFDVNGIIDLVVHKREQ